ncbi:hypothetical protein DMC30DRAFT_395819 [Rhodotorula diobovata]|uniref:Uncharacterized protein n=1 Tax=Rhodotorula diobovata TaxID=5288 RepID=A0A5C5FXX2_9BASI|nr:hypothetical protein DMC30DRAFT_395819 [Rhodotorula diobovata]
MMRWHDATAINERWDALQMAVDAVQLAYRSTFPGSHTSRTAKSPEQIWAAWYRGHQNRQRGVSRAKFERLGPVAAQLVVTAIRAVEPEVNAAKEPTAAQALLPDPFLVLEQAQVLAESAEQRLLEYAGLVSTAATLYARDQRPSRNDPGKTRSRIMNEAYMWFLGPVCLARFKEYSPLEQRRLVDKARERVYLAAQSVLVQQLWEDADQLAEELCASFKDAPAQQPSSAQLPGSSQNHPYQVDSLAHSSSAPRMSPYYARKYYSSSSLARQARLI